MYVLASDQATRVISRLKVLSERDIMQTRAAQDGALRVAIQGAMYDVRVSFFPSLYGEKVVLRLLSQTSKQRSIAGLGFRGLLAAQLEAIASLNQGFFLVTGPTGSGKTTTLYAMLSAIDSNTRNVVTFEDPIEYRMNGITQTQASQTLPFSQAVRALLRQDPDVALIGEIRDTQTGCSAIEAALTGHLVLSSLHTTGASAAPIRLHEMGVPAYLIAHALTGVLAQRLVPELCKHCKYPETLSLEQEEWLAQYSVTMPHTWRAQGCRACQRTGVQGRKVIAELFLPDQQARAAFCKQRLSQDELEAHARRCGMVPMLATGIALAQNGSISVSSLISLGL